MVGSFTSHDLKVLGFFVSSSTGCKLLELRNLSLVNAVLTVVSLRQMQFFDNFNFMGSRSF